MHRQKRVPALPLETWDQGGLDHSHDFETLVLGTQNRQSPLAQMLFEAIYSLHVAGHDKSMGCTEAPAGIGRAG